MLELIASNSFAIRSQALYATNALSFWDMPELSAELVDKGILQAIYEAWQKQKENPKNIIGRYITGILSNVGDSSDKISNKIVEEPVF